MTTAAAATGLTAGVLTWRGCSSDSLYDEAGGGPRVIPAEPLGLTRSGKLLDTDISDPFAGGQCVGYLPFQAESDGHLMPGRNSGGAR